PCPCGFYNHPEKECVCSPGVVQKYLNKISGPLLDRIDLHVEVTPVKLDELMQWESEELEKSTTIRERVINARKIQQERFLAQAEVFANAQMPANQVKQVCVLDSAGQMLLKTAMNKLQLSARAYDRILKVSRTIADLAGETDIKIEHLAEAIQFRSLDRENWAG
ncbi:MAG: ATP-binding protein, partial [Saprospiraceae bacterium]|nr:ATP-binding protein [Saprospiraceae bacterium]